MKNTSTFNYRGISINSFLFVIIGSKTLIEKKDNGRRFNVITTNPKFIAVRDNFLNDFIGVPSKETIARRESEKEVAINRILSEDPFLANASLKDVFLEMDIDSLKAILQLNYNFTLLNEDGTEENIPE